MADTKGDAQTSASSTLAGDASASGTLGKELPKAVIKAVDMTDDMQQESVEIAASALEKYSIEKDIAAQIKKEFDRRSLPAKLSHKSNLRTLLNSNLSLEARSLFTINRLICLLRFRRLVYK